MSWLVSATLLDVAPLSPPVNAPVTLLTPRLNCPYEVPHGALYPEKVTSLISMVLDFGTIGVASLAFHLIVSVPASGWYSVMHSFDVAVMFPLILPDTPRNLPRRLSPSSSSARSRR